MEEVIDTIKNYNWTSVDDRCTKIAFAVGYMKDNEKVNKKDALEIISKLLKEEI